MSSPVHSPAASHSAVLRLLATTERPPTYHVTPPTSLLTRLQTFLPEIEAANRALEGVPQTERDIECVEEGVKHIEMNVQFYEGEAVEPDLVENDEMSCSDEETCSEDEEGIIILQDNYSPPGGETKSDSSMIVDMDTGR